MLYLPLPRSTSSNPSVKASIFFFDSFALGSRLARVLVRPSVGFVVVGVLIRSDRSSTSSFLFVALPLIVKGGGVSVLRFDCKLDLVGVKIVGVFVLEPETEVGISSRALPIGLTAMGA